MAGEGAQGPVLTGHCFLSHGSRDAKRAREVRAILEAAGMTCWMAPDDIPPGADWPAEIVAAIERSTHLIVLLSATSVRSEHVSREVAYASERGIQIVPLRLADVQPEGTLRYMLQVLHRVDVFPGRIADHGAAILAAVGSTQRPAPHVGPRAGAGAATGAGAASPMARRRPLVAGLAVAASGVAVVVLAAVVLAPGPGSSPSLPPASQPPVLGSPGPAVARIAWVAVGEDEPQIRVADVDRQGTITAELPGTLGHSPTLSGDGRWLAFVGRGPDGDQQLALEVGRPGAATAPLDLPANAQTNSPVAWGSAPGARLAYQALGPGQDAQVQIASVGYEAGTTLSIVPGACWAVRPVDVGAFAQGDPTWSPDSQALAWIEGPNVSMSDAACGGTVTSAYRADPSAADVAAPSWYREGSMVLTVGDPCVDSYLGVIDPSRATSGAPARFLSAAQDGSNECMASVRADGVAVYLRRARGVSGFAVHLVLPGEPGVGEPVVSYTTDEILDWDRLRPAIAAAPPG